MKLYGFHCHTGTFIRVFLWFQWMHDDKKIFRFRSNILSLVHPFICSVYWLFCFQFSLRSRAFDSFDYFHLPYYTPVFICCHLFTFPHIDSRAIVVIANNSPAVIQLHPFRLCLHTHFVLKSCGSWVKKKNVRQNDIRKGNVALDLENAWDFALSIGKNLKNIKILHSEKVFFFLCCVVAV